MILWLDAHLPAAISAWMTGTYGVPTHSLRDLGLKSAKDAEIFQLAREAKAVVMTKDLDFVELVERLGPPPQVLWLTCGNTSNARLKEILSTCMPIAIAKLEAGDSLIEITDAP